MPTVRSNGCSVSMAMTAVVGSLIAVYSALMAMSTMTRNANVESCSRVRSRPNPPAPAQHTVVNGDCAAVLSEQRIAGSARNRRRAGPIR